MTRSFGDEMASRVGVNAEPGKNIYYFYLELFFRNFGA
jgi:hypothetical protein